MFLLDTCVISDFVKNHQNIVYHVKNLDPRLLHISPITIFEAQFGFLRAPHSFRKYGALTYEFFDQIQTLNFDPETAMIAASINNALYGLGTPIGHYDVLIGATALRHKLMIVTSNTREFSRIPNLRHVDWRTTAIETIS